MVEISHESFFGKMGNAMCGVCVGFILIPVSFYIIGYNEMNAVCTRKSFAEAQSMMVEAGNDQCTYDAANDSEFVHFSCDVMDTGLQLTDTAGGTTATATAFSMTAIAESYQYQEQRHSRSVKDSVGGGTTTYACYCYTKSWSSTQLTISSSGPGNQCNGSNGLPSCQYYNVNTNSNIAYSGSTATDGIGSFTTYAQQVYLGATVQQFKIAQNQIGDIYGAGSATVTGTSFGDWTWGSNVFFNPVSTGTLTVPDIADRRIRFTSTYASKVSAVGTQSSGMPSELTASEFGGSTIPPCKKRSVISFSAGDKTGDELFEDLKEALKAVTWVLRLITFFLLFLAFYLIVAPLSVMPDIIPCVGPCIGDLVGGLLCLCSCCTAFFVWMMVVAVCWMFFNPMYGGIILAVGICIGGGMAYYGKMKKDGGDTGGGDGETAMV